MRWINKVKEFFAPKQKEEIQVPIDELVSWYAEKIKPIAEALQRKSAEHILEIQQQREALQQQLTSLKNAKLQNEKIPKKAMVIMEGSREQFVRAGFQFIGTIKIPSHAAAKELGEFLEQFTQAIGQFSKTTKRAEMVLGEFFANNMREIRASMAQLESAVHASYPKRYRDIVEMEKQIEQLKTDDEECVRMRIELEQLKGRRLGILEQQKKARGDEQKARKGQEYQRLIVLEEQQQELERRRKQAMQEIEALFTPLIPILKKMRHEGKKNVLIGYQENPWAALAQDKELEVLNALQQMKLQLEHGSVDIKDDKKERAKKGIEKITKETLHKQLRIVEEIELELTQLKQSIAGNIARNHIAEAEYTISHLEEQLRRISEEEEKIQKAIDARSLGNQAQEMGKQLSIIFDMDVSLTSEI